MGNAVRHLHEVVTEARASGAALVLGPAHVEDVTPVGVVVRRHDGEVVTARLALQLPYDAAVGDELLVVGAADAHYVIGVLAASGRTHLAVQGDLELHASGGAVSISGDKGVDLVGPEVRIAPKKLLVNAESMIETFGVAVRRVAAMLSEVVGERHTIVHGQSFMKAKSAAILSEETVSVNGKQVRLG